MPGGSVQITTETRHGHAALSVTNIGPAIPPGEIDRLFQPFQRQDGRAARHKNGHGLGLSIVRAIATAHDATIEARPMPDGGLAIDVTFPRRLAAPITQRALTRRDDGHHQDTEPGIPQGDTQCIERDGHRASSAIRSHAGPWSRITLRDRP